VHVGHRGSRPGKARRARFYKTVLTTTPGLGKLERAVLISTARLGEEAYGPRIRREVSALLRHDYSVGAIYTTPSGLE
jgi:hypothetical protein